ncbi:putative nuclease HARBI1 [Takifugu rubripes]|uniref:putative nuclease HARBI1 n=1 Tax=Takifugu rubripes TaxID=31033 RepID=UPI001145C849|nr:putative nuclease HARBI1 [Takifugu rubripes]
MYASRHPLQTPSHSVNVQLICDANNHLLNVVSRFPGGAHDSFIFQNSSVGTHLEQGAAGDAWLIGDRGYALVTPLTNPQPPQEILFNQMHARSRSTIERTIGMLKGRRMCLDTAGGNLLYKPEKNNLCRFQHPPST